MTIRTDRRHIVTVLLQDYFHRGVFKPTVGEKQWARFESRLEQNVGATCDLLRDFNVHATFFSLGWIADRFPEIIRRIVFEGHEIASAGYWARSVSELGRDQFREDLIRAKEALERAGSNRVIGYRCAYRWIGVSDLWALEILAEEGFRYDASLRPPVLGFDKRSYCYAHEQILERRKIWELPVSTASVLGLRVPVSGGSYLRQFPHRIMFHMFEEWMKGTDAPFVLYFHPWELDPDLPLISSIGRLSRIKQYRNLGKLRDILPSYLGRGKFSSVSEFLGIPLEYPSLEHPEVRQPGVELHTVTVVEGRQGDSGNEEKEITVVIPCFNEESSLPYLSKALEELREAAKPHYIIKILFVDDKSTDGTYKALISKYGGDKSVEILRHKKNLGVAGALNTGLKNAKTDIVCTMDADCSYDPIELLNMIPLLENDVDVVTASPYHPLGFVCGVPKWRLLLSKALSRMYHCVLHHKLSTYTSCFRIYRRQTIDKVKTDYNDFRGIVEFLAEVDVAGGKIREYPTTLNCRIFGYSKMKLLRTIGGHIVLLIKIAAVRLPAFLRSRKGHPSSGV